MQVYRRIHKSPEGLETDEILNFLVMLAVSNTYYRDFDEKSRQFIDKALDLVEDKFTGTRHVLARRPTAAGHNSETSEEFKLVYFNQISTAVKTYNKQAVLKVPTNVDAAGALDEDVDSSDVSDVEPVVDSSDEEEFAKR